MESRLIGGLNIQDYRNRVLGCWLGKNIGGTLGAPFEWMRKINEVNFYTQDLGGEPLPNDDLDIQLLWLVALEEKGVSVDAHVLAEYWCTYVTPHWAEYGTGKINMRSGLLPPLTGTYRNAYKDSCGSFIRSEIWACIAPGLPDVAAKYAYEDSILDHGNGEGTYAEVFCAAMESAAFVLQDIEGIIDVGLSYIPESCAVAQAIATVRSCLKQGKSWKETRDEILRKHRGSTHAGRKDRTSLEDQKKGFLDGKLGFDVPSNIGILVLGLLYGQEDFDIAITTTVNCGEDTDCTGATVGSIFGILRGADAIPDRWITPIGRSIRTACLDLGELGYFGNQLPQTVDELTDRTEAIARQVMARDGRLELSEAKGETPSVPAADLRSNDGGAALFASIDGPKFTFDSFTVFVNYGEVPEIRNGQPKRVRLTILNTYKIQANLSVHWYLPPGFSIQPGADSYTLSFPAQFFEPLELEFDLLAENVSSSMNRCVVELTIPGRPTVMLVPITLLNGNARLPQNGEPQEGTAR